MIEIGVSNITKNYGFKKLFNNINFEIKTSEKVALIGSNGSGKSTLLNIIMGIENPDSGVISIRNKRTIGILSQIPNIEDDNVTVKDVLYRGVKEITDIKEKLEELESKMLTTNNNELDKILNKYGKLQEEFISIGGYEISEKVNKIVDKFKIKKELLNQKFNLLSGGEKTIVSFASLMIKNPDILLLDEPTNHLDIDTLEWLEDYLKKSNKTILIVSHDRYFLDNVVDKIILLENSKVHIFNGNYTKVLEENKKRLELEQKEYYINQKQIEQTKKTIKELREWGKIGDNEKFFKRANSMEKRLEKMVKKEKPIIRKDIPLNFDVNNRSGMDVIKINNLSIKFDDYLFQNISLDIKYQDRVCIMGANGCGKSTLIKEIIKNNNESIKIGDSVKIGYIPQEITFEDNKITILEEARKYYFEEESKLRSTLSKFLFNGDNIYKRLDKLSGGEKVRLKLFCLLQNKANLLVLDEPTNHLDIETRETLEKALLEFKGTIIFISHDRYFINKLATRIVYIKDKKLFNYLGNYDECKQKQDRL